MIRKPANLRRKLPVLVLCALILGLWVYFRLPCPLRFFARIPCPACGMARAWLSCFRLDFAAAFRFHPLFWTVPGAVSLILWDGRVFLRQTWNACLGWGLLLALGVCYLLRLFAFFRGGLSI